MISALSGSLPAGVRVLVATRPVDFRRGADGLAATVQSILQQDPFSGTVFVFRSKRGGRVKLLRNQLYMWRRELRSGALANRGIALPDFVPIVAASRAASRAAAIEIEIGGAVLRADAGVDLAFLGKIVRLLKTT